MIEPKISISEDDYSIVRDYMDYEDIEYFKKKLYGVLKVPKEFLNG